MARRLLSLLLAAWLAFACPAVAQPLLLLKVGPGAAGGAAPPSVAFVAAKVYNDLTTSKGWNPSIVSGNVVFLQVFTFNTSCTPSSAGGAWTTLLANQSFAGNGTGNWVGYFYKVVNTTDLGSNLSFVGTCNFSGVGVYAWNGPTTINFIGTPTAGTVPAYGDSTLPTMPAITGFTPSGATKGVFIPIMYRSNSAAESISGFTVRDLDNTTWVSGGMSMWDQLSGYVGGSVTVTGATNFSAIVGNLFEFQ